ncbi:MAG: SDR family oxidoreductase [Phycisphaerales bacterium]|nr:SDR family oxidoreductase [Phycisphaerales bacterium]
MSMVANFYKNKVIFVTGATGFLGKTFIEKMLWACPDLKKIILLLRAKHEHNLQERYQKDILESDIFERIRKRCILEQQDYKTWMNSKIEVIGGNLDSQHFYLSDDDVHSIFKQIDITFHIAANVKWDDPFDEVFRTNVIGTRYLLDVCKQHANPDMHFVYVSTCLIFARWIGRCWELPIEFAETVCCKKHRKLKDMNPDMLFKRVTQYKDQVVKQIFKKDEINQNDLGVHKNLVENEKHKLLNQKMADWGRKLAKKYNYNDSYTFSKAISEHIIFTYKSHFRCSIIRPSAITGAITDPVSGWTQRMIAFNPLISKVGTGKLKIGAGNPNAVLDFIPVDFVVNELIVIPTKADVIKNEIAVYHCATSSILSFRLRAFIQAINEYFSKFPYHNYENKPIKDGRVHFLIPIWVALLFMRLQAFSIFTGTLILNKLSFMPFVSKKLKHWNILYKNIRNDIRIALMYQIYLTRGNWVFDISETEKLYNKLSDADKKTFNFNIVNGINPDTYWQECHLPGMRRMLHQ